MNKNSFINPYNFVPFETDISSGSNKVSREEKYKQSDKLISGWLDVSVHIKTPLIIPDGAHPDYYEIDNGQLSDKPIPHPTDSDIRKAHKSYSFQKLPDDQGKEVYAIPGSELRGAIRSAYETVTDSCVPFLLKDGKISQRVPVFGALRRRGLLCFENRKWKLYSTTTVYTEEVNVKEREISRNNKTEKERYLVRSNGQELKEKNGSYNTQYGGVMQYNIPVNKKQPYHVVYLKKNKLIKTWNDNRPFEDLSSVLGRDNVDRHLTNPNYKPAKALREALNAEKEGENGCIGVPVYYFYVEHEVDCGNGKKRTERFVYLSNSAIGRIAQRRKWKEIMGDHSPCDGNGALCPACLMFGTKEGKGLKGRLRFTDAYPDGEVKTEKHVLGILGKPRTSAFEYYLNKPENATYWNYDFYGTRIVTKDRSSTEYHHLEEASPRGRKMYWHSGIQEDCKPGKLNSTMESIPGGIFKFKIFFDSITETQLGDLVWTVPMGDNNVDSNYQYKLGHAKPLGYGSCKLVIDKLYKRVINNESGNIIIRNVPFPIENESIHFSYGTESKVVRSFLKMADEKATKGAPVEYPNHAYKIYEWFAENRINDDSLVVLPDPLAEDLSLINVNKVSHMNTPKSDLKDVKGNNKRNGGGRTDHRQRGSAYKSGQD